MRFPIIFACLLLASCDLAPPPRDQIEETDKAVDNTQLRDAIQTPIERAKAAGDPVEQADKDKEQAIEDAGG